MMRTCRAPAIVVLSLLASAATASAECAWVLWLKVSRSSSAGSAGPIIRVGYSAESSYPTHPDCRAAAPRMMKFYYDMNAKNSAISDLKYKPGQTHLIYIDGLRSPAPEIVSYTLECWPDAVDPRGPKGK
jgi:hypothetical protein